jgi:hypothetical protein
MPVLGFRGPTWDRAASERGRQPSGGVRVAVVRANGHQAVLPAPVVSGDQRDYLFTDKIRQFGQWRQRYWGASRLAPLG